MNGKERILISSLDQVKLGRVLVILVNARWSGRKTICTVLVCFIGHLTPLSTSDHLREDIRRTKKFTFRHCPKEGGAVPNIVFFSFLKSHNICMFLVIFFIMIIKITIITIKIIIAIIIIIIGTFSLSYA